MSNRTPEQRRAWRKEVKARATSDPSLRDRAGHGTWYTYSDLGCRCRACIDVGNAKSRRATAHRAGRACDSLLCVRCVLGGAP
jgi:hypothetical protein